jgi:ATP diphosphatase
MTQTHYQLEDLLYLMRRLRDPKTGCPWDVKQTFGSIVPYTLEEVYEVVDTIEREDYSHLREELGDLLFQVIFYSQLGEEQSLFSFNEVMDTLVDKLVSRHPHVFPEGTLSSQRNTGDSLAEPAIKQKWETIKASERKDKGHRSILDDIPTGLPALSRAQKLQKRAAGHGFDWPSVDGVFEKLKEESAELDTAMTQGNTDNIEEELGDMLFTLVNLCRHFNLDAETSLRKASSKFQQRFQYVERHVLASGQQVSDVGLDELDQLWREAKENGC